MGEVVCYNFPPAIASPSNPPLRRPRRPTNSIPSLNFSKPFSSSRVNPSLSFPSLRVQQRKGTLPNRFYRLLGVSSLVDGNSEAYPEAESSNSELGATLDLKLPRRRLLVQFTCGDCGERTQRLINPLAYERGLVYVQCAGCERYHKLADNLGLVVEYDLRKEGDVDLSLDQLQ